MSGTGGIGIAYADRPFAYVRDANGGVYASPDFLQFLERLARAFATLPTTPSTSSSGSVGTMAMAASAAPTATATAASDTAPAASAAVDTDVWQTAQIGSLLHRFPVQTVVEQTAAIPLVSGEAVQIIAQPAVHGLFILIGMAYLTGPGSVTACSVSTGQVPDVIDHAPGAFASMPFASPIHSPGQSPDALGVDLTIGTCVQQLRVDIPESLYLNVRATFTGDIAAYGSLIVWRVGD